MSASATFHEQRQRDDAASDFWHACVRAMEREQAAREQRRPCTNCWHNDSCPPSRYCPSCQAEFGML